MTLRGLLLGDWVLYCVLPPESRLTTLYHIIVQTFNGDVQTFNFLLFISAIISNLLDNLRSLALESEQSIVPLRLVWISCFLISYLSEGQCSNI